MFLLLISFVAGVLTVLAPCILPLLPVIVGGSLTSEGTRRWKALTIVTALGVSVILFTLLLKASTAFVDIPEYTWKVLSGSIVLFFGLTFLFPRLWEGALLARASARSNILLGKGNQKNSFWGDVIVGAALGPVFSTCSPTYFIVLATVLPAQPLLGFAYLLSYTIGLCLMLLFVAFLGQKVMSSLDIAADPHGMFKKVLGALFILVGVAILTGYDKHLQTRLLDAGFFDVTKIEQKLLEKREADGSEPVREKENLLKAPELSSIDGFVNTDGKPITLESLRGKVVLLDIWTYSCINCQRTIPYLNDWYAKYKDQGFVIVGLHTPEFAFEKVQANVERAVAKFGIKYPVVLDNDYSTWKALENQYWPRKYLIDPEGFIIYDHIGEGAYEETEAEIQRALKARNAGEVTGKISAPTGVITVAPGGVQSPEIYFGSARNERLANGERNTSGEQSLVLPKTYLRNLLYLAGDWDITKEHAESLGKTTIVFPYEAKMVYMTAGSQTPIDIEIYRDDVLLQTVRVSSEDLYTLIDGSDYGAHVLRIEIPQAGLRAFTFTFG